MGLEDSDVNFFSDRDALFWKKMNCNFEKENIYVSFESSKFILDLTIDISASLRS